MSGTILTGGTSPQASARPPRAGAHEALRGVRRASRRRRMLVTAALAAALVAVALATLCLGSVAITPAQVLQTFAGHGTPITDFIVLTLRLPRLATAVLIGAAFALSGSLFQTTLRNDLASPDLMGVAAGASAGAVVATLLLGLTGAGVTVAAIIGGLAVAAVIALAAWRSGLVGYRFVLVGVAVAFLVNGVLGYLFTRADLQQASSAFIWMVGSIGDPSWSAVIGLAVLLALAAPCVALVTRPLRILGLGDDTARGLGVRVGRTTASALIIAVLLAACATSVAGPVAFVALVCGPLARRMLRGGGVEPVTAALTGAVLVAGSDLLAQHLPGGIQAPVGLITGVIGAPYLLWLLGSRRNREA